MKNLNISSAKTCRKYASIAFAGILLAVGYALASSPTSCPFVNPNTGIDCLGVPVPDGYSAAGAKWKCTYGHKWITKD